MADFKRTAFAAAAVGLADRFKIHFMSVTVDPGGKLAPNPYHLEMAAPEGLSTGGGAQAVQHVNLVPERGPAIVVGSANQKENVAEVRTHAYLLHQHAQRYGDDAFPIALADYDPVAGKLETFFGEQGLRVVKVDLPREPFVEPERKPGVSPLVVAVLVSALGVALVIVLLLLRR
jgi:hypothetical protein